MTPGPNALPILVVEDDEPTQNLLRAVLRRHGYVIDVASNGLEAIAKLDEVRYAAVVLDVMMPVAGGRDVVAFLNTSPHRVPVVVCSAAGPAALADFDAGVVKAIVRKPFEIDHLVAAVSSVADPLPEP